MKLSLPMFLVAAAIATSCAGPGVSGEDLDENVKELNARVAAAVADGREWPKYPGGLAGFLFGQDSVVGRGVIYYAAGNGVDQSRGDWREVTISASTDGTWRILAIRACEESAARELIERRDYLRQASVARMGFDYASRGPLELLSLLKNWDRNYWVSRMLPFGWVKESDLTALVELLDSPEPWANVQNTLSSLIETTRSTVGNEAAYLIEGFRMDWYPPRLNSTRPRCDIDEIMRWWEERSGS